jgi:hypothetical protein
MALLYHQGIFYQTNIVFLEQIIWWSKISDENMHDDITLARKAKQQANQILLVIFRGVPWTLN